MDKKKKSSTWLYTPSIEVVIPNKDNIKVDIPDWTKVIISVPDRFVDNVRDFFKDFLDYTKFSVESFYSIATLDQSLERCAGRYKKF